MPPAVPVAVVETALGHATHVIQAALTPVFLLTAIGSLLGVFSTRLAQVSERIRGLRDAGEKYREEVSRLRRRLQLLDLAVIAAALAGGLTCCAAILLFLDGIRGGEKATLLLVIFGLALVSAIAGLAFFIAEIALASRMLREHE